MNNRLKELRKNLNLTMEKFGEKIGIKKNTVSQLESGKNNITESAVKLICSTFNVNETWLRTGEGEMFNETSSVNFEEYAKQKNMSEIEKEIIINYLDLDVETRKKIIEMLKKSFNKFSNDISNKEKINSKSDNIKSKLSATQTQTMTYAEIDKEVEAYRQQLILEKTQIEKSSVSQNNKMA